MENNMEYNNNNETSIYLLVTTQHMMYCLNEPKNKSMVNIITIFVYC